MKALVIEEELEIKIEEEINENPIIKKDHEVEIVETINEEIIEEIVNDLDEVKLDDCNVQAPIILVGDIEKKFIDFIGVERFDLIIDSYLVNIVNCMKIKRQEVQVAQLMTFKFDKKARKIKALLGTHHHFETWTSKFGVYMYGMTEVMIVGDITQSNNKRTRLTQKTNRK